MKATLIQWSERPHTTWVSPECVEYLKSKKAKVQVLEERTGNFYWHESISFSLEYAKRNIKVKSGVMTGDFSHFGTSDIHTVKEMEAIRQAGEKWVNNLPDLNRGKGKASLYTMLKNKFDAEY